MHTGVRHTCVWPHFVRQVVEKVVHIPRQVTVPEVVQVPVPVEQIVTKMVCPFACFVLYPSSPASVRNGLPVVLSALGGMSVVYVIDSGREKGITEGQMVTCLWIWPTLRRCCAVHNPSELLHCADMVCREIPDATKLLLENALKLRVLCIKSQLRSIQLQILTDSLMAAEQLVLHVHRAKCMPISWCPVVAIPQKLAKRCF